METLARLREREFLFVTSEARNKFKSILHAIELQKSIALASNFLETKKYREKAQELYENVSDVKKSLINDESFRRPHIYTGLVVKITELVNEITASQPEAIFQLMNRLLVIKLELEKLINELRD